MVIPYNCDKFVSVLLICFEPQNIEQEIMNVEVRYSIIFNIQKIACRGIAVGDAWSIATPHFIIRNSLFDLSACNAQADILIMFFRISNI